MCPAPLGRWRVASSPSLERQVVREHHRRTQPRASASLYDNKRLLLIGLSCIRQKLRRSCYWACCRQERLSQRQHRPCIHWGNLKDMQWESTDEGQQGCC